MRFKDAKESEAVLGPLFATQAKAAIPVFGPDKFRSKDTKLKINAAVKDALKSPEHSVINLHEPPDADVGPTSSNLIVGSLGDQLEQLSISKSGNVEPENTVPASMYSSRELHDRSHFSSFSFRGSTGSLSEKLDNVLLRRAKSGYLFDCKNNKRIVSDDAWLRDVWDWIDGKCF
jgi:hypothetical protein